MRPDAVPAHTGPNALNGVSPANATWSSINLAEAVPGVMTPLCASVWVPASELGLREPFVAMGALPVRRGHIPADPMGRITNAFFGRMAVRVDFLCEMGDLIPGQSGEALARDFFGFVPPDFHSSPSNRRLPFIAARYPRTLLTIGRRIEKLRTETDRWWRREVATMNGLNLALSQRAIGEARNRFFDALAAQAVISATLIQPLQEQLATMSSAAGVDPAALLRGASHEEGAVLHDLWAASRGHLTVEEFVLRHGYHGPGEGEVETRVWREDLDTVRTLVERYRAKPDSESPNADAADRVVMRESAERALLSSSSRAGVARARIVLKLARRYIPLRGTGKVSYLQCIDVLRAGARHIGALLAEAERIDDPEDAFYLTADELSGPTLTDPRADLRQIVGARRELRLEYQALTVPSAWTGTPEPQALETQAAGSVTSLSGIGTCSGIVEGRAVVVIDPADADVDDGDILVAHTTDPSWVSLMFLSAALVVDIGGMMSHAAVVARELGIPCVMNTGNGTSILRTGDLIRVDGAAGTIEVLTPAAAS
ncbi:phosphoenolpyruvate-utilizing protein [Mycolicibacterium peregrinum]|uniref:Phosphoenolpyruvate-utilizing protein n=4 Tax=Mycolicibacterium TaxID=1866885 RepID=A0A4Z0HVD1_MYCPR|nr:phosphoenolpyruvate-utilizing protein [Mycolicibacterium porcinum]TGB45531.1 phosphoenolpyruvate-utilizing protein [Mycolicibacterium peregrinum]TGB47737.1 phosphoenolpyruvate-utilizing protein [Mycolicibacterium peregrinum]CDO30917.1 PEP-utilizing protein [Mycolicibacterium vulneris]